MMKKKLGVFAAVALLAVAGLVAGEATGETPWFDMEKCGLCKNMSAEPGLMDNMRWESHPIANGVINVAIIPDSHKAAFEKAHKNLEASAARMQAGEPTHLCGFCQGYGKLMMAGAKVESIDSDVGHIGVVTSTDPAVVAMIQAHFKKTMDEWGKMLAAKAEAQTAKK